MDQRQYPQYPQQPGGPCPPYVQQPGMEYPPYPPYGGQGSAAPPYGGSVYGQGGGPVPPRAPQYVYQTPGGKPPRRRRNRAPLVAVLLCLGLAATVFLAGEAFDALRSGGAARRRPTPGEVPSFTIEDLPEDADGGLSRWRLPRPLAPAWYASMYMSRAAFPLQAAAASNWAANRAPCTRKLPAAATSKPNN